LSLDLEVVSGVDLIHPLLDLLLSGLELNEGVLLSPLSLEQVFSKVPLPPLCVSSLPLQLLLRLLVDALPHGLRGLEVQAGNGSGVLFVLGKERIEEVLDVGLRFDYPRGHEVVLDS